MFIIKRLLNFNTTFFIFLLLASMIIFINESFKFKEINQINYLISKNELVSNGNYEELSLFSSAYLLGKQGEYANSIEKYTYLLKIFPETNSIDIVYFNTGTMFLQDALSKPLTDDGKLSVENFQKLKSAIIFYEKCLQINPFNKLAKFNLSILYSSMPDKPSNLISDKAVQELSNIPIGLP